VSSFGSLSELTNAEPTQIGRALAWFCFPKVPASPVHETPNNFKFVCPFSRAKPLSPVKAVNNAAYLKEQHHEI
jgi:hypothetical protein